MMTQDGREPVERIEKGGSDGALVAAVLAGDRNAFGSLVERHQSLVCAITYSATGDPSLSEDLAQETFLAAWRQLASLREPEKLRPWLCGIARNLSDNFLRRNRRDPIARPIELEDVMHLSEDAPSPRQQASLHEKQAAVWSALEKLPLIYREPLVLYYREEQSVEAVALALGVSEDAVRQRLSRGRGVLREHLSGLVGEVLQNTAPRKALAAAVLAALPAAVPQTAAAAVLATGAAKGSTAAKVLFGAATLTAFVTPLLGALGAWAGLREWMGGTSSGRERAFVRKVAWISSVYMALAHLTIAAVWLSWFHQFDPVRMPGLFLLSLVVLWSGYLTGLWGLMRWAAKRRADIIMEVLLGMGPERRELPGSEGGSAATTRLKAAARRHVAEAGEQFMARAEAGFNVLRTLPFHLCLLAALVVLVFLIQNR